jgi:hypothetical protein
LPVPFEAKMAKLTVQNFSCVDEAEIDLSDLTILIGPQASGKSIISKLVYFFYDVLANQFRSLEDSKQFKEYEKTLLEDFKKLFPPFAWGAKPFEISFSAGEFFVKISRSNRSKRSPSHDLRINLSPFVEREYEQTAKEIVALLEAQKTAKTAAAVPYYEAYWRARSAAIERQRKALGDDFVNWQLFVPAGRSFFTSVGKAIAAFEHGGILDPVTLRFGRLFTQIREMRRDRYFVHRPQAGEQKIRDEMMQEFFGGKLKFDREQEYVDAEDGRRLPFSILSSGQQELLPLWLALEFSQENQGQNLVYIEEPEAHLFPSAQSLLVEYLASVVSNNSSRNRMLVTTHSPYVLTQINILMKAGELAQTRTDAIEQIAKVVKRRSWLKPGATSAYAIVGRRVRKIIDDEGLIDADYLDEVSGHLAREFSRLLEIETTNER